MAVKLHRCSWQWVKLGAHPCWKVEKALIERGVGYVRVPGPVSRSKRDAVRAGTGQPLYPAIEFEDGSWYREESSAMARTIREGRLMEQAAGGASPQAAAAAEEAGPPPGATEPAQPERPEPEAAEPESAEPGTRPPEVH